jgi:hypothetical protein
LKSYFYYYSKSLNTLLAGDLVLLPLLSLTLLAAVVHLHAHRAAPVAFAGPVPLAAISTLAIDHLAIDNSRLNPECS